MSPKILFIGTTCPFGDVSGAGVRTRNVLRILGRIGTVKAVFATGREWTAEQNEEARGAFDVELVSRYQATPHGGLVNHFRNAFDPRYLNSTCVMVPPEDGRRIEELMSRHDLVWIHTLKVADAFRRFRWPSSIMDVDDFPSRFHKSAAVHAPTLNEKLMRLRRGFSWARRERLCLDRFDLLTVCKEADRGAFGDPSRVYVVPNGFQPPEGDVEMDRCVENRLGMIGDFNYLPNHDGLRWFMREVWGSVRERVPGAELRLVGKGSMEIALEFEGLGVVGLGFVPDVAEEVATWSCMIVPTRLGGGTHLKVAEGLARRVPIVTTEHGARGYRLVSGEQAYIADVPEDFARCCVTLLCEPDARARLRVAGWQHFSTHYSWDSIQPAVERVVEDCLGRKSGM